MSGTDTLHVETVDELRHQPEEFQEACRKIVISHAINELYGSRVFDEPAIALAPTPYAKWLTCRVAMEEYGHHYRFFELGREMGIAEEALLPEASAKRPLSIFEFDLRTWEEFCVIKMLGDLAEAVHIITRIKAAGATAGGQGLSETEVKRSEELAGKLSMPALARTWQMLLKGLEEANSAPRPIAATEMILIRMAHLADMPTPEEVIRGLGPDRPDGSGAGRSAARPAAADGGPLGADPARALSFDTRGKGGDGPQAAHQTEPAAAPLRSIALHSFADVVTFIGDKRDIKLKIALEEYEKIDERKAQAFRYRCILGLSYDDAAKIMDLGHAAVERYVRDARGWLKQKFFGRTEDD